jgi:hypothetical protein
MDTFRFEISQNMLTAEERTVFSAGLRRQGLDEAVWEVFDCFLHDSSRVTKPSIIRAYEKEKLAGAAFFFKCYGGGDTLFSNRLLASTVNLARMPSCIWFRQGVCADLAANPGFAAEGFDAALVISGIIRHLRKVALSLFITDHAHSEAEHPGAIRFPYVREGAVKVSQYHDISEYLGEHGKLKRKIRIFAKKGGTIEVLKGPLDLQTRQDLGRCVRATMQSSFVRTPFQDLFPAMIDRSCTVGSERLVTIIARLGGDFIGYHSFLRTGKSLRMLHGAFDRSRDSLFHAYENIITAASEHALKEGLEAVHFGPVMNETKRRMMNSSTETAIFFTSRNALVRAVLPGLYRRSSMQSEKLLAFA